MADKPDAESIQTRWPACRRCGSEMQEGLLADHGEADFVFLLHWHSVVQSAVSPKQWSFSRLFKSRANKDFEGHAVHILRCESCGCMEFFAP
jgi:hypothetical protein